MDSIDSLTPTYGYCMDNVAPYIGGRHNGLASERTYTEEVAGSAAVQRRLFRRFVENELLDMPVEQFSASLRFEQRGKLEQLGIEVGTFEKESSNLGSSPVSIDQLIFPSKGKDCKFKSLLGTSSLSQFYY